MILIRRNTSPDTLPSLQSFHLLFLVSFSTGAGLNQKIIIKLLKSFHKKLTLYCLLIIIISARVKLAI